MSTTDSERLRAVRWKDLLELARTIRRRAKAFVTYNMFYHVEHHLFPAVPTCKLPILARRLDDVVPAVAARRVF